MTFAKKVHNKLRTAVWVAFLMFVFIGCDKNTVEDPVSFDQAKMLEHVLEQIIKPAYVAYQTDLVALKTSWETFGKNLSLDALKGVRETFGKAYVAWTHCEQYTDFGPAMEHSLEAYTAIFPVNIKEIETNIQSGSYDLGLESYAVARGFSALDYLLYAVKSGAQSYEARMDAEVLETLKTSSEARMDVEVLETLKTSSKHRKYFLEVLDLMVEKGAKTRDAWSGDYGKAFVKNLGVSKGSSIANLVNNLSKRYETIKNGRLGIPLGKRTLGKREPYKLEALCSGLSKSLMVESIKATLNLYKGQPISGQDGLGFDDWLQKIGRTKLLDGTQKKLYQAIDDQLSLALKTAESLPNNMLETLLTDDPTGLDKMEKALSAIQKAVVLIKVDMTSALGVQIVYQDNDGD